MNYLLIVGSSLLLVVLGCSSKKTAETAPPLQFDWPTPVRFQVVELITKKANTNKSGLKILFHCELVKTNKDYFLNWLDAKIIEANGIKASQSEEWKRRIQPLEVSFRYPTFHIDSEGHFLETINFEDYVNKTDKMLDKVVPARSEDTRKSFSNLFSSDLGKAMFDQLCEQIWQTWVDEWTGVDVAAGKTKSFPVMVSLAQSTNLTANGKISNLGSVKSDTNYLNLAYLEDLLVTNTAGTFSKFIQAAEQQTGKTNVEPITNEWTIIRITQLEIQTKRQTLMPHWAKRTQETWASDPAHIYTDHLLEAHEYVFEWNDTNNTNSTRSPKQP